MDLSAFSIERMTAALEEFDIESDEEDVCMEDDCQIDHAHGHGHATAHGHGHEEAHGHAEAAHGHGHEETHGHGHDGKAKEEGCEKCETEKPHEHAHKEGKKKKKVRCAAARPERADHPSPRAARAPPSPLALTLTFDPLPHWQHDLSGVGSLGLTATKPLNSAAFNKFMSMLLQTKARDLYRSKGILAFEEEGDAKFIFQGVHEQIQYTTAKEPWGATAPSLEPSTHITPPQPPLRRAITAASHVRSLSPRAGRQGRAQGLQVCLHRPRARPRRPARWLGLVHPGRHSAGEEGPAGRPDGLGFERLGQLRWAA